MSFVLAPIETITKRLLINVPAGVDAFEEKDLVITWKYLDQDAREQLNKDIQDSQKRFTEELEKFVAGDRKTAPKPKLGDVAICERLITNIEGLLDASGKELTYSTDLLKQLLKLEYAAKPLMEQMVEVVSGRASVEALEKN